MLSKTYFIATSPKQSSLAVHYWELANALADKGHKVVLLIDKQKFHLQNKSSNPSVYVWPSRRPTKIKDAIFLWKLIRTYAPSCLIANFGSSTWMLIVGWLLRVKYRIAYYHTMKAAMVGGAIKLNFLFLRSAIVHQLATHCITPSIAAQNDCAKALSFPRNKMYVLRNSMADIHARYKTDPNISQKKILCVGRLHPVKGHKVLLKAVNRLFLNDTFHQDWSLHIIGTGPTLNDCIELAKQSKRCDIIYFMGEIPMDRVYQEMASSYVLVVPSLMDNVPLVIEEALSLGIPVIASNCGGIPEMIRDGVEGLLFTPGDDRELAEKLEYLLKHPEVHGEMKKRCRERFVDVYEQKKVIKEQADWYEQLVNI